MWQVTLEHVGSHPDSVSVYRQRNWSYYSARCRSQAKAGIRLDLENEPQPDRMLFIRPEHGGQVQISSDDYALGPPEFIAEVAGSSLAYDRGPKLRTFLRHGVKEYLLWRVEDDKFEWYVLRGANYELLQPRPDGVLCSEVFPGLWLNVEAMLSSNLAQVLEVLQQGIASPEHQRFIASK